ncbi:MAG: hypothetical protein KF822_04030 [Steroidobacteraceae bacterium]|nr:hypothetical protein [Steroidobacteraceae bacterium]
MQTTKLATVLAALLLAAGCGGGDEGREAQAAEPPMKVEDTVVGDLVTAPARVEDSANAAVDAHREALRSRLEADEGAPPGE